MSQLFRTKDIDSLVGETHAAGKELKRSLGPWSLIAFGIGAVIGAGIFTVTGTAAAGQHLTVPSLLNAPLLDVCRKADVMPGRVIQDDPLLNEAA